MNKIIEVLKEIGGALLAMFFMFNLIILVIGGFSDIDSFSEYLGMIKGLFIYVVCIGGGLYLISLLTGVRFKYKKNPNIIDANPVRDLFKKNEGNLKD